MDFTTALNGFLAAYTAKEHARYSEQYPNLDKPTFYADPNGRAYVRIVRADRSSRSVVAFVRKTDGAILKGSWKAVEAPKVARGNIYSAQNGLEAFGPSGHINYLR